MNSTGMGKSVPKKIQTAPIKATTSKAIANLVSEHREVEGLLSTLDAASISMPSKKAIFETLSDKLTLHMKLEDSILYPAPIKIDEDGVLEATEEHANIKSMLCKISEIEPSDETFNAKIIVLKELVDHHHKEEEEILFPECEKSIAKAELANLGRGMVELAQNESVPH